MMILKFAAILIIAVHGSMLTVWQPLSLASQDEVWQIGPAQCQLITAALDGLTQSTQPDEKITVVARLGAAETRPEINRRRLHNVRVYWTKYLTAMYLTAIKRKPESVILTEGERVEGDGRLEFYIEGKLKGIIKIRRDADLYVGTCYPPDDSYIRNKVYDHCWVKEDRSFYPCLDRRQPRKKRRARGSI